MAGKSKLKNKKIPRKHTFLRRIYHMTQEELKMKLTEWRHYLHAHPETAFEETNTAAFVAEKLREIGLTVHEHIGGTGVVADLKVGDGPQVIGLRADMDAINLKETTGLPYQSLNPEKCMDAAMTAIPLPYLVPCSYFQSAVISMELYAVSSSLQKNQEKAPGPRSMTGFLEKYPMDEIYGIHNAPFLPEGELHTKNRRHYGK